MSWQYFIHGEVYKLTLGECKVGSQGQTLIIMIVKKKKILERLAEEIVVDMSKAYTQASYR